MAQNNSNPRFGIFAAICRWLVMFNWNKARGIQESAERMFTDTSTGIGRGFDMTIDQIKSRWENMKRAIAQMDTANEMLRVEFDKANAREEKLLKLKNGAKVAAAKAKAAAGEAYKEDAEYQRYANLFSTYSSEIKDIEARCEQLNAQMDVNRNKMEGYYKELDKMQAETRSLEVEKGQRQAEFEANRMQVEMDRQMAQMTQSIDRSPLEAIRKRSDQLSAEARVSSRAVGRDLERTEDQLLDMGAQDEAMDELDSLLAEEEADKAAKSAPKTEEERPDLTQ